MTALVGRTITGAVLVYPGTLGWFSSVPSLYDDVHVPASCCRYGNCITLEYI